MSVVHELLFAEMCLVCQTFLSFVISVRTCQKCVRLHREREFVRDTNVTEGPQVLAVVLERICYGDNSPIKRLTWRRSNARTAVGHMHQYISSIFHILISVPF